MPGGTVFEYVKRSNLIVSLVHMHRKRPSAVSELVPLLSCCLRGQKQRAHAGTSTPYAVFALAFVQFVVAVAVSAASGDSRNDRPKGLYSMQIGMFEDHCPDVRGEIYRLWTYQFLHAGWGLFFFNLLMQTVLGLPVNMVHGNASFLVLSQGGTAVGALTAGFADSAKVISNTVSGATGGVYALLGVYFANLAFNWQESSHGLLSVRARLLGLVGVVAIDVVLRAAAHPNEEHSPAVLAGGIIFGVLYSIAVLRNLQNTHAERTYLVPASMWLLSAYVIFGLGWYAAVKPPTRLGMFQGDAAMPCCWKFYDCSMEMGDTDLFTCASDGNNLMHRCGATSVVKSQTCAALQQYAGLQRVYFANNPSTSFQDRCASGLGEA